MASEWSYLLLEEGPLKILDGDRGKNYPNRKEFQPEGHCVFLNTGNVTLRGFDFSSIDYISQERDELLRKGKLQREDVVLTTRGTVGNSAYYDTQVPHDHIRINSGMVILRSNSEILYPRFLYLFVRSSIFNSQVLALQSGSAQPQLPIRDLRRMEIPLPPLPEQKAIAHILGSLDDKIELNRRMNETLEAMAQALFKSWFVDFDPVIDNALEAGNPIPEEFAARADTRRKALDDGTANREATKHFPSAFQKNDEMGWIPEGWEVSTIGEEVDSVGGATPSTKNVDFWDGGDIHWTTPKDLSDLNSRILLNTDRQITEAGLKKISSGLLPVDTVLMSSRAPVGYLALAKVPVAINQGYIAMKCTKQVTPEYVIQWADSVMDDIKQRAGGTTFAEISKKNFRGIPVIVPSGGALEIYSQTVKGFYNKITENLKESSKLEKIRDTLLPKLISGELRIEDAEKMVGDLSS